MMRHTFLRDVYMILVIITVIELIVNYVNNYFQLVIYCINQTLYKSRVFKIVIITKVKRMIFLY